MLFKFFKSDKRPHDFFCEESKKYGDIWTFAIGKRQLLVLNGYDIIHEAIVKRQDVFGGRPEFAQRFFKHTPYPDAHGMLTVRIPIYAASGFVASPYIVL